jgi:dipeptidase D
MVCEKAEGCEKDMAKEGLDLVVDGDTIRAEGTTLGGDDGIAVAMALAILETDELPHPPLEVLLTVDEEIGLLGAAALDGSPLDGRLLINIDSEDEGVLTVSCAGGVRADVTLPIERIYNSWNTYKITVDGLQGGHSGVEIDKGRLNANIVMGQFLKTLETYRIVRVEGGQKDNAIPGKTVCVLAATKDITPLGEAFAQKHRVEGDPDLTVTVEHTLAENYTMTDESTQRVVEFLTTVPNGIISMSESIDGLVQTSLNLGILKTETDAVNAGLGLRSSVDEEKTSLLKQVTEVAEICGGCCKASGDYPAWEYCKESRLRDTMCAVWEKMYGEKPQVVAIHAGLECGYLCDKLPGLDAVSIGPDMQDIHTYRERLSISSVERIYRYVCEVLRSL